MRLVPPQPEGRRQGKARGGKSRTCNMSAIRNGIRFSPEFYSICNVDFVQRLLHDMQLVPRAVNLLLLRLLLLLLLLIAGNTTTAATATTAQQQLLRFALFNNVSIFQHF